MSVIPSSGTVNIIRTGPSGGVPVVLVHPVGMDLNFWRPQIEVLHENHDVVAFDLPGHGLSAKLSGDLSFAMFATVLADVIDNLACGPVNFIGISFGGMVIQTLAIERPELVHSLVLIGTACTFPEGTRGVLKERAEFVRREGMKGIAPLSLSRWLSPQFSLSRPDIADWITKTLYQQDPDVHAEIWDMISTLNIAPALSRLSIPAMIIVGELDTSTPLSAAQALAEALHTANLHVIAGASHFTSLEAAEKVNRLLLSFIDSV